MEQLIAPYGGKPVDLLVPPARAEELKKEALSLSSIDLDWRQIGELEMLMSGAYAPLQGYMGRADYESVLEKLSLADGTAWTMPLTLRLKAKQVASLKAGDRVALRDSEGFMLAVLDIAELWQSNTTDERRMLERSLAPDGVDLTD